MHKRRLGNMWREHLGFCNPNFYCERAVKIFGPRVPLNIS
jgi:hypothetical protein